MSSAVAAVPRHRFTIRTEARADALARLLEPFVVNDVAPSRIEAHAPAGEPDYRVTIEFAAEADLAHKLAARLTALYVVSALDHLVTGDAAAVAA